MSGPTAKRAAATSQTRSPTAAMIGAASYRYLSPACQVVRSKICGKIIHFTVTDPKDIIQQSHVNGVFYEPEELAIIGQWFRPGSVFCDVGANIGNHSIFALKFLGASRAILFEPNPAAIEVLRSNIHLNGLRKLADLTCLGFGLSDTSAAGLSIKAPRRNLGAGRIVEGGGRIKTVTGDAALADRHVDFIKMDIEGMEMRALAGLSGTIARCRPTMFVEVDNVNDAAFLDWVTANGYRIETTFQRYPSNINYLISPL